MVLLGVYVIELTIKDGNEKVALGNRPRLQPAVERMTYMSVRDLSMKGSREG